MGWFEALVLGVVQGLTEFLPISSSGHVRVVSALFGWEDPGAAFSAVIQVGTELAVIVYFHKEIWAIIRTWTLALFRPELRSDPNARMGWFVIIGTIPIGVIGFAFQDVIEHQLRSLVYTGLALIIFGAFLGIADAVGKNRKRMEQLTVVDALLFGLAQCLALIPGVSRSGGTITAGLLMGYRRQDAAKYSFLLAIPAVLASAGLQALKIDGDSGAGWGPTILATVVAFAVALPTVRFLMNWVARHTFSVFVFYRFGIGALILILLSVGVLHPLGGL